MLNFFHENRQKIPFDQNRYGLCLDMEKKTTNFLPKGFLTASVFPNFLSLQP